MMSFPRTVSGCRRLRPAAVHHVYTTSARAELSQGWRVHMAATNANDPSEDRLAVVEVQGKGAFFGVFDGHGGFQCSEWCRETMLPEAARHVEEGQPVDKAMTSAAATTEETWLERVRAEQNEYTVGSCVCVAHVDDRCITVGNIGDCRCIVGTTGSSGQIKAIALSRDHNARMPEEQRKLILEHPGEADVVMRADRWSPHWYIKGRLQPSRSIGDFHLKLEEFNKVPGKDEKMIRSTFTPPYLRADPQVISRDVVAEDRFVILATDGLWDGVSNEEAVKIVQEATEQDRDPAESLIYHALSAAATNAGCPRKLLDKLPAGPLRRRIHDDITVVVVQL